MRRSFFKAAVVSILLYGCTTWTLTKRMKKTLDGNYARMLRAILNKSWRQHLTKQQLYGSQPPITKTIKIRRTIHCSKSKDELISDVLQRIPSQGHAKAGWPARTYIQQLCSDRGCSPEDLPEAMDDWEGWRVWIRDIRADSATWWWLWISFNQCRLDVGRKTDFRRIFVNLEYRILSVLSKKNKNKKKKKKKHNPKYNWCWNMYCKVNVKIRGISQKYEYSFVIL